MDQNRALYSSGRKRLFVCQEEAYYSLPDMQSCIDVGTMRVYYLSSSIPRCIRISVIGKKESLLFTSEPTPWA